MTNDNESTTSHEDDISDNNFTFLPYVHGKDNVVAFDLPDPYAFPDDFTFIPLAKKRFEVSTLRPHPQATPLRLRHRRAPSLRVPTPIPERPSLDEQF